MPHRDVFWYRLNGMGTQKKMRPKSYFNFFPYIFHVKAKRNIVYEYFKKNLSRDTNIISQMH